EATGPPRPFKVGWHNSSIVRRSGTGKSPPPAGGMSSPFPLVAMSKSFKRVGSTRGLLRIGRGTEEMNSSGARFGENLGKMTRKPFSHRTERATDLLGIIHTDVCGPLRHVSRQVFETFKVFKNEVENQLGKTIKALRSDRGGEYISQEFQDYLKACGTVQQLTPPYTPQHNGVSERRYQSATRILNMVPIKKVDKTPYELWYGKVPNLSYLKVWGCETLVKWDTPDKLQQRFVKCIFIGYPKETMGYYFYFSPENKIVVARSERTHQAPNRLCLNIEDEEHSLGDLNEPTSYKAAMLDPKSNKWLDAMNAEMQSMKDNQFWQLVDLPPNFKTIGKTFLPVADIRAIRILMARAAYYDYEIWQLDVKIAFLNGYLDEDIYMVQPEGFVDPKYLRKVCKLQRSIYGLKQASRSWNKRFDEEVKKFGFAQNLDEPCVYQKASGSNVTFLIFYVDDNHGKTHFKFTSVKDYLGKCFAMKDLGKAAFIFRIKIYRDRSKRLIRLGQNDYMDKILKRYKMDNSKRGNIPTQERLDLNNDTRCTILDVAFAQNITSRFQQNPGKPHWTVVKNILKYLRNTKDMFLVYGENPKAELRVDCYCDVGFETDKDDIKTQT
nr:hypothetical protein [Tanacetum cinerariifolium]